MNYLQRYETFINDRADYAYTVLRWSAGVMLFLAGFHKFFNITSWASYIAPWFTTLTGIPDNTFMLVLGSVELVIGLLLLADYRTVITASIATVSLLAVLLNLLTTGQFVDILIRDVGLFGLTLGVALLAAQKNQE